MVTLRKGFIFVSLPIHVSNENQIQLYNNISNNIKNNINDDDDDNDIICGG